MLCLLGVAFYFRKTESLRHNESLRSINYSNHAGYIAVFSAECWHETRVSLSSNLLPVLCQFLLQETVEIQRLPGVVFNAERSSYDISQLFAFFGQEGLSAVAPGFFLNGAEQTGGCFCRPAFQDGDGADYLALAEAGKSAQFL